MIHMFFGQLCSWILTPSKMSHLEASIVLNEKNLGEVKERLRLRSI